MLLRLALSLHGGLWRDEALFLAVAQLPSWDAMLGFLRFHESHPPLFYALMRLWILMFGDTDARSIVLPVFFGVALIPVIYFVGKSLFCERVGLLAAALACVSPALTEFSATVRPYSLMPILSLLSTYTLIRGLERGGVRTWVAQLLSTVALVYTHNWGWLIVGGEWVSVLVIVFAARTRPRPARLKEWLGTQLAIAIAYLPWASTLVYQLKHAGHAPSLIPLGSDPILSIGMSVPVLLKSTLLAYSPSGPLGGRSLLTLFFAIPLLLVGIDLYLRARNDARTANRQNHRSQIEPMTRENRVGILCLLIVPAAAWIAALILSGTSNLMIRACMVTLAPLLLLSIAYWVQQPHSGRRHLLNRGAVVSFFLTYAVSLYFLFQTSRSNARSVASAVAIQTRTTDLVIVTPEWLASSFNRYYTPSVEQIDYPHFRREQVVDFSGVLDRYSDDSAAGRVRERVRNAKEQGRRVWLVVDRDDHLIVSTATMQSFLESADYGKVAFVRTNQVYAELERLYGSPAASIAGASRTPRYEDIHAFLYAPRDTAGH